MKTPKLQTFRGYDKHRIKDVIKVVMGETQQSKFAKDSKINPGRLSRLIADKDEPSAKEAAALGLVRTIIYVPKT